MNKPTKLILFSISVLWGSFAFSQPANISGKYYLTQGSSDVLTVEDWRGEDPPTIIIRDQYGAEYLKKISIGVWRDNGGMTAKWKNDVSFHWGPELVKGKLYYKEGHVPGNPHLGKIAEGYYNYEWHNGEKRNAHVTYENNKQTVVIRKMGSPDVVWGSFTLGPKGYMSGSQKIGTDPNKVTIIWDNPGGQKDFYLKKFTPTKTVSGGAPSTPTPPASTTAAAATVAVGVNAIDPVTKEAKIHKAVAERDYDQVEAIIKDQGDVNLSDGSKGRTALHYAAIKNDVGITELLIENEANINKKDNSGQTALSLALETNNYETAKALLKKNASASGEIAGLDRVVKTKETEILILMLQNGADGNHAARKSIEFDNVEMLNTILDNSSTRATNQLFEQAVYLRSQDAAIELLVRGIDKDRAMDYVIQNKDKTMVGLVLGTNASVSSVNKALAFASSERDLTMAATAIEKYNADPTNGMAPAVTNGHLEMVKLLLRNGADPNDQLDEAAAAGQTQIVLAFLNESGNPDLGVEPAAENDKLETLQTLLDNGGDANKAMPLAIEKQNIKMVDMCISARKPADVYRTEYIIQTCEKSNVDILNALLLAGADPNPGMSVSIANQDSKIVRELIGAGARVDRPEYLNKSAELKDAGVAKMLLEAGADPNTAMMISVEAEDVTLVQMMLEYGADATPSQYIAKSSELGNAPIVDMLLDKGADGNHGMMPGVENDRTEVVSHLLKSGADGSKDMYMSTSVQHNNVELTRLLIEAGGNANTALTPALDANADKVIDLIKDYDVEIGNIEHLVTCVDKNHTATARVIVDAGASAKGWWNESKGQSLLHRSILQYRDADMASVLIKAGADVNKKTSAGDSPLHLAVKDSKKEDDRAGALVQVLINADADVNAINGNGETVLKAAPSKRAITKPLKAAGAKKRI